jgi:hypothetical protein
MPPTPGVGALDLRHVPGDHPDSVFGPAAPSRHPIDLEGTIFVFRGQFVPGEKLAELLGLTAPAPARAADDPERLVG